MKLRNGIDRRTKRRFATNRELHYTALEDEKIVATGRGETIDMSSGGVAFRTGASLTAGNYFELSISWPALLHDTCPVRLIVYGKAVRRSDSMAACTVEKWEFRTGSRQETRAMPARIDHRLLRWMEYRKEVTMKAMAASAGAG